MKVLVCGSLGSMGRRYVAILRYLREEVIEADIGDPWWEWEFDRVIIATPTDRHSSDIRIAITKGKPTLCEKPITQDTETVRALAFEAAASGVDVRMVSNWRFAINLALMCANGNRGLVAIDQEMALEYSYYDSGKDGFFWDTIQLIMLAGKFKYDRNRPAFEAKVDGLDVTLEHIHASYVLMISEWLYGDKGKLWSLADAITATEKVEWAIDHAPFTADGEINFQGWNK